jgi:predicted acetyltransferase
MEIELQEAAANDVPVLRKLMQLYLYDLGSVDGWDIGDDGTYGNAVRIEGFWDDPQRERYLVKVSGKLAGFALTRRGTYFSGDDAREISEFFILRKHRRRGVGRRVAIELFERFDGTWEVAVMRSNTSAQDFWQGVVADYTDQRYEEFPADHGSTEFVVFRFTGNHRRRTSDAERRRPA